jgi:hypothetical protein
MTAPDTVIINSLEQILSTDLNRIGGLAGKAVQDALVAIEAGLVDTPRDCTRRGLFASPGTGMQVIVTAGELLRFNASVTSPNASRYEIGRLNSDTAVAIAAAHSTLPRIDVVYATLATSNEDSTVRNILVLPNRTVSPTSVYKSARPGLTLGVATGTPASPASFSLAGVPAGSIPLWYVYVPAAVTSIQDNHLVDLRVPFLPTGLSRRHGRDFGFYVDVSLSDRDAAVFTTGRAFINGAQAQISSTQTITKTTFGGSFSNDTEYHFYAVVVGQGSLVPVGKNVPNGIVFIASTTAPSADGRPSAAIVYNPFFGIVGAPTVTLVTTTQALYVGTLRNDSVDQFDPGAGSIPLNEDGSVQDQNASPLSGGFPGLTPGWIREPRLEYVSSSSVQLVSGVVVLSGRVIGFSSALSASFPTNLASGEVEAPSTFYYVYLRPKSSPSLYSRSYPREVTLVISSEAPDSLGRKPTPETGFQSQNYLFAGSFFNNSSSNIQQFVKRGPLHLWLGASGVSQFTRFGPAEPAAFPTLTTVTLLLPSSSKLAQVMLQVEASGSYSTSGLFVRHSVGLGVNRWSWDKGAFPVVSLVDDVSFVNEFLIGDGSGFQMTLDLASGAGNFDVRAIQTGYWEDVSHI